MKNLILSLVFISSLGVGSKVFAQNSSIDPNFVQFPKLSAVPTCVNADKGKQYFNTTDSKMYFCNGTAWVEVGAITLPYLGNANSTGTVGFQINQSGGASSGVFGIFNAANNNPALNVFSNGTNFSGSFSSSNATPKALRAMGGVQFSGIGEGTNRVLTSDGFGNATWQSTATLTGLDVNGLAQLDGEVNRTATGTANMLPIAYGNIATDGLSVTGGTGNITISKVSTGIYDVTITGENINSLVNYFFSVTPLSANARMVTAVAQGPALRVRTFDASGIVIDTSFSFVIYKL